VVPQVVKAADADELEAGIGLGAAVRLRLDVDRVQQMRYADPDLFAEYEY